MAVRGMRFIVRRYPLDAMELRRGHVDWRGLLRSIPIGFLGVRSAVIKADGIRAAGRRTAGEAVAAQFRPVQGLGSTGGAPEQVPRVDPARPAAGGFS